ncbi:hypothetical protein [Streptomyces sp. UNOC14_S4]|uniref:hypothetical protein n=1 Tax=Streptomyces sp. UNOC14_S4 TaxID=2872340 RepID=UPI001E37B736|nr:hypothetical protein [Streptomyces sp. UNOC14_S4]MCC3772851.1 hypothetical protein [Streptomyces sp. UNOC14_S4]
MSEEVISLPLASGPGVVVGGVADRCPLCVRLRAERHMAWAAREYEREIAARHTWLTHYESVHEGR